jgi:YCII-related domain
MPTYVLAYRNPAGYVPSPENGAAWRDWFQRMGDQLVDPGQPVTSGTTIGNCSPGSTQLGGFSLIRAADLDAAVAMAKGCPVLARGGGVEIGELGEVPASAVAARQAG